MKSPMVCVCDVLVGIVYCFSRKDTEEVSSELCQQGIKAACYHGDVPQAVRSRVHAQWLNNSIKVCQLLL